MNIKKRCKKTTETFDLDISSPWPWDPSPWPWPWDSSPWHGTQVLGLGLQPQVFVNIAAFKVVVLIP